MEITHAYLGNLLHKRGDDGFLYVKGLVSDDTLDLDQQRCDPAWLDDAIPKWFKSAGNIRVMHQPVVGGKAKEIAKNGTGWDANIKVTNKQADIDIEEGALTGLSVGIKNARVEKSLSAPNGLIVGGDIIEVSLVDRPANPSCVIEIAKMAGDGWQFTGIEASEGDQKDVVVTETQDDEEDEDEETKDLTEIGPNTEEFIKDKAASGDCPTCDGTGKIMDGHRKCPDCDGTGDKAAASDETVLVPDAAKFVQEFTDFVTKRQMTNAEINDLPDSDFAYIEPGGKKDSEGKTVPRSLRHFPINDAPHVRNALARAPQSPFGDKAMPKIRAAASRLGIKVSDKGVVADIVKALSQPDGDGVWTHDPAQLKAVAQGIVDFFKAELDEYVNGDDESWDIQCLTNVLNGWFNWWNHEASEGETTPPFDNDSDSGDDDMANAYISLGVSPDLIKAASAEDAPEEVKTELKAEIRKAVGFDEEIATYKAQITELQETVTTVKAALEEVQEMAAPGGPVLRQTSEQRRVSAAHDAISTKAAEIRARADAFTGEPSVRQALYAEAEKLEVALSSL